VTGAEFKRIREAFGLSATMGRALGYSGLKANIAVHIGRLERGDRPHSGRHWETCANVLARGYPDGMVCMTSSEAAPSTKAA
jgi:hypothetical protein